ncbi:MAG: toll/interleukin-1 receptor domain-containing protein [Ferruginibacter sp.]
MTKIKLFFSYSNLDKNKMKAFKECADEYKIFEILIQSGDNFKNLSQKVIEGIDECDYFIPLLTQNSKKEQWINQEIGYAFAKKQDKILPIVDKNLVVELKGFINNQLDLPFCYQGDTKYKSQEAKSFKENAQKLLENIKKKITLKKK